MAPASNELLTKTERSSASSPRADVPVVRLALRPWNLTFLAVATIAVVAVITGVLSGNGIVLRHYERHTMDTKKQETLVEKYNSYSGFITSAIERPLEAFGGLLIQAVVLRFLTAKLLQHEGSKLVWITRSGVGAGVTFLLANGLSAVNVQVREKPVESVLSPSDLLPTTTFIGSTSMAATFAENAARNAATNTILRNLILPKYTPPLADCPDDDTIAFDNVTFELPQQPWLASLIPHAIDTNKTVRIPLTTKPDASVTPDSFPMNASTAADLVLYSYLVKDAVWATNIDINNTVLKVAGVADGAFGQIARMTGFLPPSKASSELDDRAWFLEHIGPKILGWATANETSAALRSWTMDLSRVEIAPSAWVDAVTTEREMAFPRLITHMSKDNKTSYLQANFASTSRRQFLIPGSRSGEDSITAYGLCGSESGADVLEAMVRVGAASTKGKLACGPTNTTGFLVLSLGSRLVADGYLPKLPTDAYLFNPPTDALEFSKVQNAANGVLVNVREILTMTIARLNWTPRDLAAVYNAKCTTPNGCQGVDVALTDANASLVLSAERVPTARLLAALNVVANPPRVRSTPLVSVDRPTMMAKTTRMGTTASSVMGDYMMAHNVRDYTVTEPYVPSSCAVIATKRVERYVNNHMYMESTLQPSYTAAAFFMFQDAVRYDVVPESLDTKPKLTFPGNTQRLEMYVYIPKNNVYVTLGGCVVAILFLVALLLYPCLCGKATVDPLQNITTPHTIARVLLDEEAFPSSAVSRTVISRGGKGDDADDADAFVIQSLQLQPKEPSADTANALV